MIDIFKEVFKKSFHFRKASQPITYMTVVKFGETSVKFFQMCVVRFQDISNFLV